MIGDAAYNSEENYEFFEHQNIAAYLKCNTYHKDRTPQKKSRYHKDNFLYDAPTNTYRCPEGQTLVFQDVGTRTTASGYQQHYRQLCAVQHNPDGLCRDLLCRYFFILPSTPGGSIPHQSKP